MIVCIHQWLSFQHLLGSGKEKEEEEEETDNASTSKGMIKGLLLVPLLALLILILVVVVKNFIFGMEWNANIWRRKTQTTLTETSTTEAQGYT